MNWSNAARVARKLADELEAELSGPERAVWQGFLARHGATALLRVAPASRDALLRYLELTPAQRQRWLVWRTLHPGRRLLNRGRALLLARRSQHLLEQLDAVALQPGGAGRAMLGRTARVVLATL